MANEPKEEALTVDDLDSLDDAVEEAQKAEPESAPAAEEPAEDPGVEQKKLERQLEKASKELNDAQEKVKALTEKRNALEMKLIGTRQTARKRPLHELNRQQREQTKAETERQVLAREALARANSQMGGGRFSHPKPRVGTAAKE